MTRTRPPRPVPATTRATYEAAENPRDGFGEDPSARCPDKNVHGKYSFTAVVPADPGKGASATRQLRDPDVRDEDEDDFNEDDSW
jgi:hypothetical protein